MSATGVAVVGVAVVGVAVGAVLLGIAGCGADSTAQPATTTAPSSAAASTTPYTSTPSSPLPHPPNPTASAMAGGKKVIFFTFDDGPDPHWTPTILQVLNSYGAHATFFEVGQMQAAHPGLREQVLATGNTIGSHTVNHRILTTLPPAELHHEVFDGPESTCLRPPDGATNPRVRAAIRSAGKVQVLWNIDPRDWARPGTEAIVHNILNHARPGAVVLLHDGGGNRTQTIAALRQVLPVLKTRGYSFPPLNC